MPLISNPYELAACLQFFSEWSLEEKATFVLSYLQSKSPSLQKALEQFRADFTNRSYQESVFNPQHLIKAFELYERVENNVKSKRSFNFTYGSRAAIFPLSLDSSLAGLGYNYASGAAPGLRPAATERRGVTFKAYVKQKQQSWENYAARVARQSSGLVYNSVK